MKGSLAASMLVGAAAVREGFRGDVIVAAVADEEVGSVGTEALVRRTTAGAAIVTEPTEEVVSIAHKGFVAFEVETTDSRPTAHAPTSGSTRSRRWGRCSPGSPSSTRAFARVTAIRCSAPDRSMPR